MTITIYHNPACGTSRNVLELIRNTGEEPEVVEYLKTPPAPGAARGARLPHGSFPCATSCAGKARPTTSSGSTIRSSRTRS